jgi:hypothetical protein
LRRIFREFFCKIIPRGETHTSSNAGRDDGEERESFLLYKSLSRGSCIRARKRAPVRSERASSSKQMDYEFIFSNNLFVLLVYRQLTAPLPRRCTWVYALHDSTRGIYLAINKNIFFENILFFKRTFFSRIFFQEILILSPKTKRPYFQVRRYGYLQY